MDEAPATPATPETVETTLAIPGQDHSKSGAPLWIAILVLVLAVAFGDLLGRLLKRKSRARNRTQV